MSRGRADDVESDMPLTVMATDPVFTREMKNIYSLDFSHPTHVILAASLVTVTVTYLFENSSAVNESKSLEPA